MAHSFWEIGQRGPRVTNSRVYVLYCFIHGPQALYKSIFSRPWFLNSKEGSDWVTG